MIMQFARTDDTFLIDLNSEIGAKKRARNVIVVMNKNSILKGQLYSRTIEPNYL